MTATAPALPNSSERARPARRLPLAWLLVGGAVLFVMLAVGGVLAITLLNARDSTFALVRDKAALALTQMEVSIAGLLEPVEDVAGDLAELLGTGRLDMDVNRTRVVDSLAGALVALPQAAALGIARYDGTFLIVARTPEGIREVEAIPSSVRRMSVALERAQTLDAPAWVEPVWLPALGQAIIAVVAPIKRGDTRLGAVIASVTLGSFDTFLDRQSASGAMRAFVLYDRQYVLAHPNNRGVLHGRGEEEGEVPLPTVEELQDRALDLLDGSGEPISELLAPPSIIDARLGDRHVVLLRDIEGHGSKPWTLGLVFSRDEVGAELRRLGMTAIVGGFLLVLAIALAWLASRSLAGRIATLAAAADRLRRLEISDTPSVPGSVVRELDNAANAFNAMAGALGWFVTYVPRTLVERLMQRGSAAMATQATDVTVMFTDVRGFSALAQDLSASETADLLNRHFELLAAIVEAHGGTVDKYIGDGMMAFWGAPDPRPDHAAVALAAATAIGEAVAADNERRRGAGDPAIAIRIGLHSGPVVVGNIGSRSRLNYTIVGDTVNVAARLEQLGKDVSAADDCIVLLSDAVRDACHPAPLLTDCGEHALRGRAGTLRVWRVDTAT